MDGKNSMSVIDSTEGRGKDRWNIRLRMESSIPFFMYVEYAMTKI